LVIELRDKFKDDALLVAGPRPGVSQLSFGGEKDPLRRDAIAALLSLGYAEIVARRALSEIEAHPLDTVQHLIKKSLGVLSR
jgi:Holliday junction resolvasome RuvABC DNA-binding subunit